MSLAALEHGDIGLASSSDRVCECAGACMRGIGWRLTEKRSRVVVQIGHCGVDRLVGVALADRV